MDLIDLGGHNACDAQLRPKGVAVKHASRTRRCNINKSTKFSGNVALDCLLFGVRWKNVFRYVNFNWTKVERTCQMTTMDLTKVHNTLNVKHLSAIARKAQADDVLQIASEGLQ